MAVKPTPPEETANQEPSAQGAEPGPTEEGSTATPAQGTTAGGALGGDAAGRTTPPGPDTGFFGWLRSLGVPRQPGWLGGVAAGVSARLGIDPIIMRGVLVVCALFGAPVVLFYAIAWLLLPDLGGRIHLEELFRGVFDKALVGIAVLLLIGLTPLAFTGDSLVGRLWGSVEYGNPWTAGPWTFGLPVLWTLVLIGGITALVIWLVRRERETSGGRATAASTSPEAAFAQYEAEAATTGAAAATGTEGGAVTADPRAAEPVAPLQPTAASGTTEYEAWKAQHEAWRIDHAAWKQSQADANRAARDQLVAENRVRAAAFAAQADEARRIRKLTRPRTSFAYIVATLGAALVAGAAVSIVALGSSTQAAYAGTIGTLVATIVVALSMVVAGFARRRSGFLTSVAIVLLVISLVSALIPRTDRLVFSSATQSLSTGADILQPVGSLTLVADDTLADAVLRPDVTVVQGAGSIYLEIRDGARVQLEIDCGNCSVSFLKADDDGNLTSQSGLQLARDGEASTWTGSVGIGLTPGTADASLAIRAGATTITVVDDDGFDPGKAGS
ncbi:MAG: PspC domain-containing protein [Leifsonia sp.]